MKRKISVGDLWLADDGPGYVEIVAKTEFRGRAVYVATYPNRYGELVSTTFDETGKCSSLGWRLTRKSRAINAWWK